MPHSDSTATEIGDKDLFLQATLSMVVVSALFFVYNFLFLPLNRLLTDQSEADLYCPDTSFYLDHFAFADETRKLSFCMRNDLSHAGATEAIGGSASTARRSNKTSSSGADDKGAWDEKLE